MNNSMLSRLQDIVLDRKQHPKSDSYTNKLLDEGLPRIAQKMGEEGIEVVIAALAQDDPTLLNELADLLYHCTVLLAARNLRWEQVEQILAERHR